MFQKDIYQHKDYFNQGNNHFNIVSTSNCQDNLNIFFNTEGIDES